MSTPAPFYSAREREQTLQLLGELGILQPLPYQHPPLTPGEQAQEFIRCHSAHGRPVRLDKEGRAWLFGDGAVVEWNHEIGHTCHAPPTGDYARFRNILRYYELLATEAEHAFGRLKSHLLQALPEGVAVTVDSFWNANLYGPPPEDPDAPGRYSAPALLNRLKEIAQRCRQQISGLQGLIDDTPEGQKDMERARERERFAEQDRERERERHMFAMAICQEIRAINLNDGEDHG